MVMIAAPNVSTPTALASPQSTTGFSVVVSNLNPSVTQAELFNEIGPVQSVQVINSSTAMVT